MGGKCSHHCTILAPNYFAEFQTLVWKSAKYRQTCYFVCYCFFQFAACRMNSVGVSDSSIIYDQRFSASSCSSSDCASNGRLNGQSAWIPSRNNNNNDYLQIDLGSVYVVCAVATQGNPSANDWTETYKIETSLDNVNWQWYQENNAVKVCMVREVAECEHTQIHLSVIKQMTI